jgi:uncharacterized protein YkwD
MTRTSPRSFVRFRAAGLLAGGLLASILVIAPATSASAAPSHAHAKRITKSSSHHRKASKHRSRHKTTTHHTTTAPASKVTQASVTVAPPASAANIALEDQVFAIVNQERGKNGCGALRNDSRLRAAARAQSVDMVTYNYFSHTGHDGSSFVDRQKRAGYTAASGENIAWGFRTASDVMVAWMNSPGHRANILNCQSVATGVGVARKADGTVYWTQEFGRS